MISPGSKIECHSYCLTRPHSLWVDFLLWSLLGPGTCWPFPQESVEEGGEFGRGRELVEPGGNERVVGLIARAFVRRGEVGRERE